MLKLPTDRPSFQSRLCHHGSIHLAVAHNNLAEVRNLVDNLAGDTVAGHSTLRGGRIATAAADTPSVVLAHNTHSRHFVVGNCSEGGILGLDLVVRKSDMEMRHSSQSLVADEDRRGQVEERRCRSHMPVVVARLSAEPLLFNVPSIFNSFNLVCVGLVQQLDLFVCLIYVGVSLQKYARKY